MQKTAVSILIGLFFAIILFNSCGTKYSKEVAGVDTLQVLLNRTQADFNTIDTAMINLKYKEIKDNISFIQQNYTDTLAREMAEFLGEYSSLMNVFSSIKEGQVALLRELYFSSEQLRNFRHDLEHNILKEENVKTSYDLEEQAVKRNIESVKVIKDVVKSKMDLLEKLDPKVKQLMADVKLNRQ